MATYERLDYGSPDGSQWGGASTDAIGFYGATPVTRGSITNVSTTSATTQIYTTVSTLVEQLKTYGLIA